MSARLLLAGIVVLVLIPTSGVAALDVSNSSHIRADTGPTADRVSTVDRIAPTLESSDHSINPDATATRTVNTTNPRPGATVRATTTVTLDSERTVDLVDEFDPEFASTELVSIRLNGTEISPDFRLVAPGDILVSAENVGPGALEFVYDVTVPVNASAGQTHTFDGLVQIDGNTNLELSDSQVVVTPPTAEFAVSIDSVAESVVVGENVSMMATVTNIGDTTGTQTVSFVVNGTREDSKNLTLASGENETTTFEYATTPADRPGINLTVVSANETAQETVAVLTPDSFTVEIDSVAESVVVGENVTMAGTVTNTGDTTGTQAVSFVINGTREDSKNLTLAGGENTTVMFSYRTSGGDTPNIEPAIATANETATTTVDVLTPASFGVELTAVDDAVVAGQNTTVEARVMNKGNTTGTQTVEFAVNGERKNRTTVTLGGGGSTTLTFTYATSETNTPEIGVSVASANETVTTTVEVLAPASFTVAIGTVDDPVIVGEVLTVAAAITNRGDVAGTRDVDFAVDGKREGEKTVALDPGANQTVTFGYEAIATDRPAVNLTVASANETATATATVLESPTFEVDIRSVPDSVMAGEALPITYVVENTGEKMSSQNVTVVVEGETIVDDRIELGSEESATRTTEYSTAETDVTAVSVEVATANDTTIETVELLQPAAFVIDIASIPVSAITGESVPIEYAITNIGGLSARQNVEVVVGGETVANETVELAGGESTTRTTSDRIDASDLPEVSVKIVTANDTMMRTVDVLEPGAVVVAVTSAPESVAPGETANLEYVAQNTGDEKVTQDITVTVQNRTVETETVELAGGEQFNNTVTYETSVEDTSDINATVASADHSHTVEVAILEPGALVINRVSTPDSVTAGNPVSVEYTLENIGDMTATEAVTVTAGGETVVNDTANLGPGQSTTKTVTYPTNSVDTPSISVTVASANETMTKTISVVDPANLDVGIESVPDSVVAGEALPITYVAENTGERTASQIITISVDSATIETKTVELGSEESIQRTVSYETDNTDVPEVSVTIASANSTMTTTADIVAAGEFVVTINETLTDTRVRVGETATIVAVVEYTGTQQNSQEVALSVNGTIVMTTTVTTAGSEQLEFSYAPNSMDVSEVSFRISTAGDTATGNIAVNSTADNSSRNTINADGSGSGFGLISGLLAILLGIAATVHRLQWDNRQ